MKKLVLSLALLSLGIPCRANPLKTATRYLTNALCYLVASSDASEATQKKAQNFLSKLDPSKKLLAVRTFNALGKFLFGTNNTVTLPYLNYLMIDEEIETLPEDEQRFVLGRAMAIMDNKHTYAAVKYLIPYALSLVYEQQTTNSERSNHSRFTDTLFSIPGAYFWRLFGFPISARQREAIKSLPQTAHELIKPLIIASIGALFSRYISRNMEYELDKITVEKLSGQSGGIGYLSRAHWQAQESNPFLLYMIKQYILPYYLQQFVRPNALYYVPFLTKLEQERNCQGITYLRPPSIELMPQWLLSFVPGKAYDDAISTSHIGFLYLPYIYSLLRMFPTYKDRIEALYTQEKATS